MKKALLLVDIQNDYFQKGKMELVCMEEAAENAKKVLESFRASDLPIIHIQHISVRPGSTFFLPDTEGVEINNLVKPGDGELVIQKNYPSSFRETELEAELNKLGVKELVICGAMTHMCIDTTVRAAFDLGFSCTVVADACATRDLEYDGVKVEAAQVQASFMGAIGAVFAKIIKADEVK